jgi:hypothetical protein
MSKLTHRKRLAALRNDAAGVHHNVFIPAHLANYPRSSGFALDVARLRHNSAVWESFQQLKAKGTNK